MMTFQISTSLLNDSLLSRREVIIATLGLWLTNTSGCTLLNDDLPLSELPHQVQSNLKILSSHLGLSKSAHSLGQWVLQHESLKKEVDSLMDTLNEKKLDEWAPFLSSLYQQQCQHGPWRSLRGWRVPQVEGCVYGLYALIDSEVG